MLRKQDYSRYAFALTLICGLVPLENRSLFGQTVNAGKRSGEITSVVATPSPHSPPILLPPQNPSGLWNQLFRQGQEHGTPVQNENNTRVNQSAIPVLGGTPQPNAIRSATAQAVTIPMSDETEKAIAEVRIRLGNSGNRFSDLLSPEDEAKLFAEALSQVRQEQQSAATSPVTPSPNPLQSPSATPHPVPPHAPVQPQVPMPPQVPGLPPVAGLPMTPNSAVPSGAFPEGHFANPQLYWAPGQPNPPHPPAWSTPQPNGPALHAPMSAATPKPPLGGRNYQRYQTPPPRHFQPAARQPETEQAAMRRIAVQIDALAEQLENIKRYSEADSLRRSAQQFREAVR